MAMVATMFLALAVRGIAVAAAADDDIDAAAAVGKAVVLAH